MTEFISVYITVASEAEAEKIASALVDERLAACANIFPGVKSIYRWQGKVERAEECALIAKTTNAQFKALNARVKELHSYECPSIVAWPIVAGDEAYLEWIKKNGG